MNATGQWLEAFEPAHEFFIGVDSDGSVFDTMELKQKECFVPAFIRHFRLQAVSRYAREVWEFVNLYSRTRGINRFPGLSNSLNLLAERPEVEARGVRVPGTEALDAWLAATPGPSNAALEEAIEAGAEELAPILAWSQAVNAAIEEMVHGVPPFPGVPEILAGLGGLADVVVVSQTPIAALAREWEEHQLTGSVALLAGQEHGSKAQQIKQTTAGRYPPRHVLVIGDSPGDFRAARANLALFYPILPGAEEHSWIRFQSEALERFLTDTYAGGYEEALVAAFFERLPEKPPWTC